VALAILVELNTRLTLLVVETGRLERRGVNDVSGALCNLKMWPAFQMAENKKKEEGGMNGGTRNGGGGHFDEEEIIH
jgi:hypothetical protein